MGGKILGYKKLNKAMWTDSMIRDDAQADVIEIRK